MQVINIAYKKLQHIHSSCEHIILKLDNCSAEKKTNIFDVDFVLQMFAVGAFISRPKRKFL